MLRARPLGARALSAAPAAAAPAAAGPRLLLVDAMPAVARYFMSTNFPPYVVDGQDRRTVAGFSALLMRLVFRFRPTHAAVCFDSPAAACVRRAAVPTYKQHRTPLPEGVHAAVADCRAAAEAVGLRAVSMDGHEADDVVASLAAMASGSADADVVIAGTDKDLYQCLDGRRVQMWHLAHEELRSGQWVQEQFGVPPAQFADLQALAGDRADSIPGVRGVGPAKAARLLGEFAGVDDLLARVDDVPDDYLRGLVAAGADDAREALSLTRLRADLQLPGIAALDDVALDVDADALGAFLADQGIAEHRAVQRAARRLVGSCL